MTYLIRLLAAAGLADITRQEWTSILVFLLGCAAAMLIAIVFLFVAAVKGDEAIARARRQREASRKGFEVAGHPRGSSRVAGGA